jgi:hypothetical protein
MEQYSVQSEHLENVPLPLMGLHGLINLASPQQFGALVVSATQ